MTSRSARAAWRWISGVPLAVAFVVAAGGFCAPASAGVDRWTSIGPQGGPIPNVVTDPTASGRLYVADGDIYKSDDGGVTWKRITPPQPATPACSSSSPPVVQGDGAIYVTNCHGLYKSANQGVSWTQQNVLNASLSGDPTNPLILYAVVSDGTTTGLLKTTDGGTNWLPIQSNLPAGTITPLLVDPTLPSRLYALAFQSVYRSLDSGVTWTPINSGLPSVALSSLALSGSTVLVATGGFGVYKSINAGASWTAANAGIATQAITLLGVGNGATPMFYAAAGNGGAVPFFKSIDGGTTWSSTGTLNARIGDFAVSRQADDVLYAATQNGLATSANGGATWTFGVNNGLDNEAVAALFVDTTNPLVLYAASATVTRGYISTDRGGHWTPLALADGSPVQPLGVGPIHSGTVYGENCPLNLPSEACLLYRSVNFGVDWTQVFSGVRASFLAILEAPDVAGRLFAIGNQFDFAGSVAPLILRSDDNGVTWPPFSSGLPAGALGAIAMDPTNSNVLYAGVGNRVYKTINAGGIWVNASGALPEARVNAIGVNPAAAATVFAGLGNYQSTQDTYGLYRSIDGGTSWGPRNAAFVDLAITAVAFDRANPSNFYAGTSTGGLYRSTDGGANWRPINNGLTDAASLAVNAVAVDPIDGRNVYIATNAGAFALTINAYDAFVSVIEFYNYNLDHYFIASELQLDVPALDSGRFSGWVRTGQTFKVYSQPTMTAQPVCRFYIPPQHGDSHFYSASLPECAAVLDASINPANPQHANYTGYVYETTSAFYVDVPTAEHCPGNEVPVSRLWNQRIDSNHRYTIDPAIRDAMIAKGYLLEGVVMCALQ